MAITTTSNLTPLHECDVDDWTGDATVAMETEWYREPAGCMGLDCDVETNWGSYAFGTPQTLGDTHIYIWINTTFG